MIIDIPTVEGGEFIDGGPNTLGTIVTAEFLNSLMKSSTATTKEIQTILTNAGIAPDSRVHDQLFQAINKMVIDKAITITSVLGDSKELAASQFLANENNRAAKNAQTTANAANDKANQAKQESYESGQKAEAALKSANEKIPFGSFGMGVIDLFRETGGLSKYPSTGSGIYNISDSSLNRGSRTGSEAGILMNWSSTGLGRRQFIISMNQNGNMYSFNSSGVHEWKMVWSENNTRTDKNGVIFSGTKTPVNTLNVNDMSQQVIDNDSVTVTSGAVHRAINSLKNNIFSINQNYHDVTAQREINKKYVNASSKTIVVQFSTYHVNDGESVLLVDDIEVAHESAKIGAGNNNNLKATLTAFVNPGSSCELRVKLGTVVIQKHWSIDND